MESEILTAAQADLMVALAVQAVSPIADISGREMTRTDAKGLQQQKGCAYGLQKCQFVGCSATPRCYVSTAWQKFSVQLTIFRRPLSVPDVPPPPASNFDLGVPKAAVFDSPKSFFET